MPRKPIPIGFYHVVPDATVFRKLKEEGFSHVHHYGMARSPDQDHLQEFIRYCRLARENGLLVIPDMCVPLYIDQREGVRILQWWFSALREAEVLDAIDGWYFADEPDTAVTTRNVVVLEDGEIDPNEVGNAQGGSFDVDDVETIATDRGFDIPPDDFLPFYQAAHTFSDEIEDELGRRIPVIICNAWSNTWHHYDHVLDCRFLDFYPIKTTDPESPGHVESVARLAGKMVGRGKPSMPVLQAFKRGGVSRFPHAREIRYWLYSSLVHGSAGMFFFSHHRCLHPYNKPPEYTDPEGEAFLNDVLFPTVHEFRETADLIRVLEARRHTPPLYDTSDNQSPWFGNRQADWLLTAMWYRSGGNYLVSVNNNRQTGRMWRAMPLPESTLTPVGDTRDVNARLSGGKLRVDRRQPLEVFVWRMSVTAGPITPHVYLENRRAQVESERKTGDIVDA